MRVKPLAILPLLVILAAGCTQKGATTAGDAPPTPTPTIEAGLGIPEDVVNDGLRWMGYPFDKKVTYKAVGFPPGSESEQTVVPSYDKDRHELTISYEGTPSNMPSETYHLRADGMFGISLGGDQLEPVLKAISATAQQGETWQTKGVLKQIDPVNISTTLKIGGMEKVTVPAGEFDALVITETGTMSVKDLKLKVSGKGWFVQGIGAVKRTVAQTYSKGNTSNITIEATKIQ
jgi:hypothetical protein